jgi:YD repeat-containing protein
VTKTFDGTSSPVTTTDAWTYDTYGRETQETTTANGGTPGTVVHNTSYVWNDGVTATQSSATGTYIIDTPAFTDTEDGSGNRLECSTTNYDGQSYATGQTSALNGGLDTSDTSSANCNSYTTSGPSTTTTAYDTSGDVVGTTDPDANASISGHTGCTVGGAQYTECSSYDTSFIVGLVLYIWAIRYDLKMRHQRGKRNFFMKRVERIGDLLMTLSLAFPTVYAVLQRPLVALIVSIVFAITLILALHTLWR